jgi:hypothetical protein
MADSRIPKLSHAPLEGVRQVGCNGNEIWLARPLGKVLD